MLQHICRQAQTLGMQEANRIIIIAAYQSNGMLQSVWDGSGPYAMPYVTVPCPLLDPLCHATLNTGKLQVAKTLPDRGVGSGRLELDSQPTIQPSTQAYCSRVRSL
eukprot:366572-Chlamydomonas_euryale.AAC.9